ncbi:hypothetical protein [Candidatus Uabimicrobium sp. HlEnr_7]|uniref:hypothetical protein n=1 Tax=Candidatus Uabimicrobium helgolandensis TaxID=3095367 RepID=UPI00355832CE
MTTVTLPKNYNPFFPKVCIYSGKKIPDGSLAFSFEFRHLKIPICKNYKKIFYIRRYVPMLCAFVLIFLSTALEKYDMLALGTFFLALLIPISCIYLFPEEIDIEKCDEHVDYEFQSNEYAQMFIELNRSRIIDIYRESQNYKETTKQNPQQITNESRQPQIEEKYKRYLPSRHKKLYEKCMPFKEWVRYCFDRPVSQTDDERWYFKEEDDWGDKKDYNSQSQYYDMSSSPEDLAYYEPDAEEIAKKLEMLFNNAELLLKYTHEQINQGLWFIAEGFDISYLKFALTQEVPVNMQIRWMKATKNLYRNLFSVVCSHHYNSSDSSDKNPVNDICFMFWNADDFLPLAISSQEVHEAALDVLMEIIQMDHPACIESGLHALGHWYLVCPEQVEAIIDGYLENPVFIDKTLKLYAKKVRNGDV